MQPNAAEISLSEQSQLASHRPDIDPFITDLEADRFDGIGAGLRSRKTCRLPRLVGCQQNFPTVVGREGPNVHRMPAIGLPTRHIRQLGANV